MRKVVWGLSLLISSMFIICGCSAPQIHSNIKAFATESASITITPTQFVPTSTFPPQLTNIPTEIPAHIPPIPTDVQPTPTEVGQIALPDGSVVILDEGRYPAEIVRGQERITVENGLWINKESQTVNWWNINTKQFEELEHIKPNEIIVKDNIVTGVMKVEGVTYPVVVVDIEQGELSQIV